MESRRGGVASLPTFMKQPQIMEPEKVTPAAPEPIPTTAPTVPTKLTLREDLVRLLDEEGVLTDDERSELRDNIANWVNEVIDIPIIGEKIEGAIIRFAMKVAERTILHYAKGLIDKITG